MQHWGRCPLSSHIDHGRPQEGATGVTWPPGFRQNFSHVITVAPWVEIQMQGLNLPTPLNIQWRKCFQLQGGLRLPNQGGSAPRPPLSARAPHSPWCPPTTDPFRRLWPSPGKKMGAPDVDSDEWRKRCSLKQKSTRDGFLSTGCWTSPCSVNITIRYDITRRSFKTELGV